ncbi:hypothetical protein [Thermococcus sp.]
MDSLQPAGSDDGWWKTLKDSLVFSFPYAGKTRSVPVAAFDEYLQLLNFSDTYGILQKNLLRLFRAVLFRNGVLLYLPGYGLKPYAPEPYSLREYLLVRNELNAYSPPTGLDIEASSASPTTKPLNP